MVPKGGLDPHGFPHHPKGWPPRVENFRLIKNKRTEPDGPVFISHNNWSYRRKNHFRKVEPKQQGGRKKAAPFVHGKTSVSWDA